MTLFHWGWILTTLITLAILYFFFGHHIDNPYLSHPEYDANFVMNYMGLGLTDGMFWLAQLAADKIYFLVIFAAMLLGVGMLRLVIEIGKLTAKFPIVQGGMGVRVSLASLAAAVANEGGIGTIAAVGLGDLTATGKEFERKSREALVNEIHKAREMTSGLLAVNIMGALSNARDLVKGHHLPVAFDLDGIKQSRSSLACPDSPEFSPERGK